MVGWSQGRQILRGTLPRAQIPIPGHCYPADAVLKKGDDDAEDPFFRGVADRNCSFSLLRKVLA